MKLLQLLQNVDKSPDNQGDLDWEELCQVFSIDDINLIYSLPNELSLKCYWVGKRLCTDTHVGLKAYYFNDVLVGYSEKVYRKSDTFFKFIDEKSAKEVHDFILSLNQTDYSDCIISSDTLEEEAGEGYTIEYTSQLLGKMVIYWRCSISG